MRFSLYYLPYSVLTHYISTKYLFFLLLILLLLLTLWGHLKHLRSGTLFALITVGLTTLLLLLAEGLLSTEQYGIMSLSQHLDIYRFKYMLMYVSFYVQQLHIVVSGGITSMLKITNTDYQWEELN